MYTKLKGLLCVTLVLLIAGVSAGNTFTDAGADHLWNNPDNWSDGVPVKGGSGEWARMTVDGTLCIIDSTVTDANASGVYPGCYGGDNEMHISGGYLDVQHLNIGRGEPNSGSKGYLKMTGGVIDADGLAIPNQFSGTGAPVEGQVDLFGGTINVSGYFGIGGNGGTGRMNITDGTLIVSVNATGTIEGYIENGLIIAYGGEGCFALDYDQTHTEKTTLTAYLDPNMALDPSPEYEAGDIPPDVELSWSAGDYAASHDIYFGPSEAPPFIQNQPVDQNSYDPCGLLTEGIYYWQINEINDSNEWEGNVWKFTVENAEAQNPVPSEGAERVAPYASLSWSPAGEWVQSYNVYFGTTNPPGYIGNQPVDQNSFDPGGTDWMEFNTTYYWQIDEVNGSYFWPGDVWSFTTDGPPEAASNPTPSDGAEQIRSNADLSWTTGERANSHDIYFGTDFSEVSNATDPNTPPGRGNLTETSYNPGPMHTNTTYYWRIDEKNIYGTTTGPVWSFKTFVPPKGDLNNNWIVNILDLKILLDSWLNGDCGSSAWCEGADIDQSGRVDFSDYASLTSNMQLIGSRSPYTDYCSMLSQEIQGKKHGFAAGNLVYYVGGRCGWGGSSNETIGLTHPFFRDGRSRGTTLIDDSYYGTGNDRHGWDFYQYVRTAYGTVVVGETEYVNPVPTEMYWRPDKMICEYNVGGVNIHEEKFITENDVVCSIVTSDEPVTIKFEGRSFWSDKWSETSTASCELDDANNAVHIVQGGTAWGKVGDSPEELGPIMYQDMDTVVSTDKSITDYSQSQDGNDVWEYEFKVGCDSSGTAVSWAMADDYDDALARVKDVRSDPEGEMAAKTASMNDKLNYQVPYFRCSDQDIVDVYYYLYALHTMYYIDVGIGWEEYPHTQTAVNNFMGHHHYDGNFQNRVGNWMADKEFYAYGNYLNYKNIISYARDNGALPEWWGQTWVGGAWGAMTPHVVGAWQCYEHTGDVNFVDEAYNELYKPILWDGMGGVWGCDYDAAECLHDMAVLTDDPNDPDHWYDVVNMDYRDTWLNNMWEKNDVKYYFGAGDGDLGWSWFATLRNSYFPEEWAAQMTEYWAVDDVNGFYGQVPITTRALKDWTADSPQSFAVTPDTNYYAQIGMFKRHTGLNAINILLNHLKKYNMEWGIPVAPEARDRNFDVWGDQYSNFNAGKILLILEGLCGLEYSIPDETFTVCDHMPKTWDYMEMMVPITKDGVTYWPRVRITRQPSDDSAVKKTIRVTGCPLDTLKVQPFLEEMTLATASDPCYTLEPKGHISYTAAGPDFNVALNLDDTSPPWPDPAQWKVEPNMTGRNSISMEAKIAIDKDGVEYFFECTTDNQFDSGWQDEPTYEATGLSVATSYTFRVKARDKSSGNYQTEWSNTRTESTFSRR